MKVGEVRFVVYRRDTKAYVYDTFHGCEVPFETYRAADYFIKTRGLDALVMSVRLGTVNWMDAG